MLNALREWNRACPKGDLDLVFPNGLGKVESYANLIDRGFGYAPLRPDFLTLDISRVETCDDIGFADTEDLRNLRGSHELRRGRRRPGRACRSLDAGGRLGAEYAAGPVHHLLRHSHSHCHFRSHAARAAVAFFQALRHLKLDIVVEISHRGHARPLVDRLLDFRRHRHVLEDEARHLETVLRLDHRVDQRQQRLAQLGVAARHVEYRNLRRRQFPGYPASAKDRDSIGNEHHFL